MLSTLGKISADNIRTNIFLTLPRKQVLTFPMETICMKCQILFSGKNIINNGCLLYFIASGEISVYLVKIKVVSITSELISYHFTSD